MHEFDQRQYMQGVHELRLHASRQDQEMSGTEAATRKGDATEFYGTASQTPIVPG